MKKIPAYFISSFLIAMLLALEVAAEDRVREYARLKNQIVDMDKTAREIMARLYQMNEKLKGLSKKRDRITNDLLKKEAEVRALSKDILKIEESLKSQRKLLSRRMRALYMLGEDKLLQVIFTAQSAEDLNQSLFYLKRFAQSDFKIVKGYRSDLEKLKVKQAELGKEVKRLLSLRGEMKEHQLDLDQEQRQKSVFLASLSDKRKNKLRKLRKVKSAVDPFDVSFFEQKGKLSQPVAGRLTRTYGVIENEKYGYQLAHKGFSYVAKAASAVKAVFKGRVVHMGHLPGYGKTVILDHGDHYYSVYSRLQNPKVTPGQEVSAEEILEEAASELYFEIRHFSDAIDPAAWLNLKGKSS